MAGQTSANVDLSVVEDTMLENTESVILTLTGTSDPDVTVDTSPGAGSATINIADDDTAQVSVVANEPSASEPGDVGQFTVSISETSDSDTVISYSISGDATPGTDFTALTGTVTIIAGQSSAVVDVNVLDDSILEDNESVTLTLTGTDDSDVTVDTSNDTAIVTIMDDDTALASIIANDLVADESGDTGQFIVTLSNASDRDTIVNYVVTGTAVDGDDFVSLAGSVTVLAGQTTATIDLTAIDDSIVEGGESVVVSLVSTDDADVGIDTGANTATVTIEDNDAAELTIASTSDASEPSTNGQFTVTLSAVSATDTVVNYIVGGDATAGDDYVALSGTITILAGATTGVIDVNAIDDTVIEDIESVSVTLDSVTAGDADITIGAASSAIVQITDNDSGVVNLLANIDTASEPSTNGQFTVSLDAISDTDTILTYAVAGDAVEGIDYSVLSGTVTISAGTLSSTIDIDVLDDSIVEDDDSVSVTLTSITSGDSDIALGMNLFDTVTILDDDSAQATVITGSDAAEPASNGQFVVSLDAVSDTDTTLAYNITGDALSLIHI